MSAPIAPGTVHAGWRVDALQQDGATPRYAVTSEDGAGAGTLTFYPFGGEASHRHRALAERVERSRGIEGPGLEPLAAGRVEGGLFVVVPEADRFGEERLDPDVALDAVADAARALAALHRAGQAHGEVDAWSVIRKGTQAALLPPGLRLGPAELDHQLALQADPRYAAPEVLDGRAPTPASDVFSLGLVLYRLLTGQHPVNASDPVDAFVARAKTPVPDLAAAREDAPPRVVALYRRACAAYDARPPDADAFLADLEAARKTVLSPPTPRVAKVPSSGLGCALFALLLAVAAVAGATAYAQRALPVEDPTDAYRFELPPSGGGR